MAKAKEKKEEVVNEPSKATEALATENAVPQLTVQDLVTIRSCIELGSQRGAWRANELTAVGAVYEKLSAFLQTLLPPKDAGTDESTADKGEAKND